jgi:GNAT superfamily N-acetyltransferase
MAIIVQKASAADVPRACEIEAAAYAETPANTVLFPGPFPADMAAKKAERLITEIKNDLTVLCLKAVDEETGEIIAFAKWHIYTTPEAAAAAEKVLFFGPGTNQDACYALFGGMAKKKKELLGNKPHICMFLSAADISHFTTYIHRLTTTDLHLLHTDPKHQRRGAASLLVQSGLRRADELNLPVYLESSPVAHAFYQKQGLNDVENFSIDLSQFGAGKEPHSVPIMMRQPTKAQPGT